MIESYTMPAKVKIKYKAPKYTCMTLFVGLFVLWAVLVLIGMITMLLFLPERFFSSLVPVATLLLMIAFLRDIGRHFFFDLLGSTEFIVDASSFTVKQGFINFSNEITFVRSEIQQLKQVQDGGEGIDNFPSWGLTLVAEKDHRILSKQDYSKSECLGYKLSKFLAIPFILAD